MLEVVMAVEGLVALRAEVNSKSVSGVSVGEQGTV